MKTPAAYLKLKEFYLQLMPALSEDDWAICEQHLRVRTLKKGELLQPRGTVCSHVSFVNYGLVRMYYLNDGKEKVTDFFREGEYTCDYRSFLLREPALSEVQVLEDTEVVETSYEGLQTIYREVPLANTLGRLIAEKLFIDVCNRSETQANDTLDQQYQNLIDHKPWLIQRVPQYMIASYLGITPEALSRIKARVNKKARKPELVY